MRKYLALSIYLFNTISATTHFTSSRSFLFTRPIYDSIATHQFIWKDVIHEKKKENKAAFQIIGMF